jgi:hypothetical protein
MGAGGSVPLLCLNTNEGYKAFKLLNVRRMNSKTIHFLILNPYLQLVGKL